MAEIIFVHGIAQEQYSAKLLEKDWLPALAGGVGTAGFSQVADRIWHGSGSAHRPRIEARMAFYGDLFLEADKQDGGEEIPVDELPSAAALARVWLEAHRRPREAQAGSDDGAARAGRNAQSKPASKGRGSQAGSGRWRSGAYPSCVGSRPSASAPRSGS